MADLGPTYFECDCHSHMLVGNVASIDEAADGWKWIELAMWQQGSHRHPWGYRLRHIWHIIWRGTPYLGFTSFDAETARKLRDWLTEAAAQVEGTEVRGDAANMTVALASEVERLRGVVADARPSGRSGGREMSQVKQVECDRCHKREESPGVVGGQITRPATWKFVDNRDLCPKCYADFKAWMAAALEEGDH